MQYDYTQKDIDRFWGKVQRTNDPNQCWLWMAGVNDYGYGRINWSGSNQYSNRVAWMITFGEIPEGLLICHTCDNPPCCNPAHLFLGTKADNNQDKMLKGRHKPIPGWKGEENPNSKLTDLQVEEIRRRYKWRGKNGNDLKGLSQEFGVTFQTIGAIVNRKSRP